MTIVGKLHRFQVTPLKALNWSFRQKINTEIRVLKDTSQVDLIDIYRTFYSKATEYTFFSHTHEIFSKTHHMLWHKASLSIFKKTEIISSTFSDYNGMKPEINYKKKTGKTTKTWRFNNMLENNQWFKKSNLKI